MAKSKERKMSMASKANELIKELDKIRNQIFDLGNDGVLSLSSSRDGLEIQVTVSGGTARLSEGQALKLLAALKKILE